MELAETLFYMMQKNAEAMQLTDLVIGTVTRAAPLEITINTAMAPLKSSVLLLTENVVEKKISALTHKHEIPEETLSHYHYYSGAPTSTELTGAYDTDEQLSGVVCVENGVQLPTTDDWIIINRALAVGDRVLLLRVQHGQKFVVLSRVFDT